MPVPDPQPPWPAPPPPDPPLPPGPLPMPDPDPKPEPPIQRVGVFPRHFHQVSRHPRVAVSTGFCVLLSRVLKREKTQENTRLLAFFGHPETATRTHSQSVRRPPASLSSIRESQYRSCFHNYAILKAFAQWRGASVVGAFLGPLGHLPLDHSRVDAVASVADIFLKHLRQHASVPLRQRCRRPGAPGFGETALQDAKASRERQPVDVQSLLSRGLEHQRTHDEVSQR